MILSDQHFFFFLKHSDFVSQHFKRTHFSHIFSRTLFSHFFKQRGRQISTQFQARTRATRSRLYHYCPLCLEDGFEVGRVHGRSVASSKSQYCFISTSGRRFLYRSSIFLATHADQENVRITERSFPPAPTCDCLEKDRPVWFHIY